MTYTEIRNINGKKYYYRVLSIRNKNKVSKKRIYLGHDLSNSELLKKEKKADERLLYKRLIKRNKEIEKIKRRILPILKKNNIKKAGIFGSYARGEQKKNSDIDILVEPAKNMGFKFAGLEIQLTKALKRKVDLVSYGGISPDLKNKILSQEMRII